MVYMNVIAKNQLNQGLEPVSLHILQDNGVDVTPDLNITTTDLQRHPDSNQRVRNFMNNGYGGNDFKISVAFKENETVTQTLSSNETNNLSSNYSNVNVLDLLDSWITNMEILYVVTDAIGIRNGEYIVTGNPNRKQNYDNVVVWDLEFKEYTGLSVGQYEWELNPTIAAALEQAKKNQAKAKAKANSGYKNKLKKCKDLKELKYKKTNKCVSYLNHVLVQSKLISSKNIKKYRAKEKDYEKYDKLTVKAIKKIQKKAKLKQTGKINKKTFNYIIEKL